MSPSWPSRRCSRSVSPPPTRTPHQSSPARQSAARPPNPSTTTSRHVPAPHREPPRPAPRPSAGALSCLTPRKGEPLVSLIATVLWPGMHALERKSKLGGILARKPGYHDTPKHHIQVGRT